MTPHPTDHSEITEPLALVAQETMNPRDALRQRMQAERDGCMALAGVTHDEVLRGEFLEYAEHLEAIMRHVDHWAARVMLRRESYGARCPQCGGPSWWRTCSSAVSPRLFTAAVCGRCNHVGGAR